MKTTFIYITAGSMDEAKKIGRELISNRLAATSWRPLMASKMLSAYIGAQCGNKLLRRRERLLMNT